MPPTTVELAELYPFYEGYKSSQNVTTGQSGTWTIAVECGCTGTMQPNMKPRMTLCEMHERKELNA